MTISDETLMAYADGQLDAGQRAALARELRFDDEARRRMEALKSQRERVGAAYAGVLEEPVPDRLSAVLAASAAAAVSAPAAPTFAAPMAPRLNPVAYLPSAAPETASDIAQEVPGTVPGTAVTAPAPAPAPATATDLAAERAKRLAALNEGRRSYASDWWRWGGIAASLVVGAVIGFQFAALRGNDALLVERGGQVVAGGALAKALDTQLAGERLPGVDVAVSFLDRSGQYCRSFSTVQFAGLACREGARWNVTTTAQALPHPPGVMRQAATAMPRAVLEAVDARIAGNALDATQERAARDMGWKR